MKKSFITIEQSGCRLEFREIISNIYMCAETSTVACLWAWRLPATMNKQDHSPPSDEGTGMTKCAPKFRYTSNKGSIPLSHTL